MSPNEPPTPPPPPGPSGPEWGQPPQPPPYGPQPGWGPPPQPPYGPGPQPGYGYVYGYAPQTESLAVVALILAIASFVVCPLFPAIAALIVSSNAMTAIETSGGQKTGEGLVQGARIVSWINLGLCAFGFGLFLIIAIAGAASS